MLSLRTSVETLRKGTLEQQIKHLERPSPTRVKPASRSNSTTDNLDASASTEAYSKVRTEFIPIEWFTFDEGDRLAEKLQRVSLPSVPLIRQFANDAVSRIGKKGEERKRRKEGKTETTYLRT